MVFIQTSTSRLNKGDKTPSPPAPNDPVEKSQVSKMSGSANAQPQTFAHQNELPPRFQAARLRQVQIPYVLLSLILKR